MLAASRSGTCKKEVGKGMAASVAGSVLAVAVVGGGTEFSLVSWADTSCVPSPLPCRIDFSTAASTPRPVVASSSAWLTDPKSNELTSSSMEIDWSDSATVKRESNSEVVVSISGSCGLSAPPRRENVLFMTTGLLTPVSVSNDGPLVGMSQPISTKRISTDKPIHARPRAPGVDMSEEGR